MDAALKWLEATALATQIRENEFLFPWVEALHVLAIPWWWARLRFSTCGSSVLLRSIVRSADLTRDILPCTWIAFAFAALTGGLLFSAKATGYAGNFFFRGKLVLLLWQGST